MIFESIIGSLCWSFQQRDGYSNVLFLSCINRFLKTSLNQHLLFSRLCRQEEDKWISYHLYFHNLVSALSWVSWIQKWSCISFHKERVHPSVPENQKSNLPLWGGTQVEGAAWDEEFIGSVKVHKGITIQFSRANKLHYLKPESKKVPIIWSAFTLQEEERTGGGRAACLLARQGTWSGWIWLGWRWWGWGWRWRLMRRGRRKYF